MPVHHDEINKRANKIQNESKLDMIKKHKVDALYTDRCMRAETTGTTIPAAGFGEIYHILRTIPKVLYTP